MSNRLINETSPYLLQHANNPVDWYPWGQEALDRAKEEDKPILLSIGYSACHWCHVMERESFENQDIAGLMNQHFVSIKVDREERPDLDAIYMEAVQMLTGSGGWPMTVFLTPDGKPFHAGTYFPPEDHGNMPGFHRVLTSVAQAYESNRGEIQRVTQQLAGQMGRSSQVTRGTSPLTADILHQAYSSLATSFDYQNGGTGTAPKFPQPMTLEMLLRYHHAGYNPRALEMVELTLDKMAYGGIYDQIGGGFHRYSTDAFWLVPHFEKMLYDNALLARLYLHAYLVTGRPLYARITQETLDYVLREMTDSHGGFYSAQDADSEGEEGKFFVWTPDEINAVLGQEGDGDLLGGFFGVTQAGNFEGKNILNVPQDATLFAEQHGLDLDRLSAIVEGGKKALREVREQRVHPLLDDKVLTSWNGLMLRSFAEAAVALGRPEYLEAAVNNANFLLVHMKPQGRLLRTYRQGQAKLLGYLEDYAFVADGLLALYEATFDRRWLEEATALVDSMIALFWDEGAGGFYDTGSDHESLVVRPRDIFDNAQPCGGSVASEVLLHLALITGNQDYATNGVTPLRSLHELMAKAPAGTGHWLAALDFYVSSPKEIAIVGPREDPATQKLLDTVFGRFLPNKVVVGAESAQPSSSDAKSAQPPFDNGAQGGISTHSELPLLLDRGMVDGRPTAYVCRNYVCQLPVTDPEALAAQLEE